MNNQRQLLLGIFFIVALSILAFYTLFLTDIHLFSQPTLETVYFSEGYGLREGDSVRVAGVQVGRVKTITYEINAPVERRVKVVLSLDEELELLEGARITIKESTLLGGRHVDIDPGVFGGPPLTRDDGGEIFGEIQRNPIQALAELGSLFEENRESVRSILSNAEVMVTDMREGKGVFGKLLYDEQMAQDLAASLGSLKTTAQEIEAGSGLLGALIYDESMVESVRGAFTSLRTVADDIRAGEGLAGRLIYDDQLAGEVQRAFESFASLGERIERGEGVAGRLLADEELARDFESMVQQFNQASSDLSAIAARLRSGEGTVGRLFMDEELYDETLTAVQLLTRSLEDYREAAPISTFTSVLFSGF